MTPTSNDAVGEWLTVAEACALIGVSPATLRRWSDAGDLLAFTTPGGHRRFARSAILARLPSGPRERPTLKRLGETDDHMTRVCRRALAKAGRRMTWLGEIGDDDLRLLRAYGRDIARSLLTHIDAASAVTRQQAMGEAFAAADGCGRIAARRRAGIPLTVETFLRFRRTFVGELVEVSRRRGFDTVEATDLLVTADSAFDRLLMALLTGYETHAAALEAT